MKKWEYMILKLNPSLGGVEEVNELGKDGWELAAAIPITELGITNMIYFVLKREMRPKGTKSQR